MDPDACLKEILELAERLKDGYPDELPENPTSNDIIAQQDAFQVETMRLCELIQSLDELCFLSFLPSRWRER